MSLPPLCALAWPPRGNGVRTGMVTDDEEDAPGVVALAPAPAPAPAPGPPSLLTERQRGAAREYIRTAMYDQYETHLDEAYPDDDAEEDEFTVYRKEYERWEEAEARRSVDSTTATGTRSPPARRTKASSGPSASSRTWPETPSTYGTRTCTSK